MANDPVLSYASAGPDVALLQLALARYGFSLVPDGVFGPATDSALRRFQRQNGLAPDGVAGPRSWASLEPWLTGFLTHTVRRGETLYRIAQRYGTTLAAIETANPELNPYSLPVGRAIVVPLAFPVVSGAIPFTSRALDYCLRGLTARYPFLRETSVGTSVTGKPLRMIQMGSGVRRVFVNAAHHANEWITAPAVLAFAERYAAAFAAGGTGAGFSARSLFERTELYLVPMVNPDGVDLVTGALNGGPYYEQALRMSRDYPQIPFPAGWKANIDGIDLNLQYPASWEEAKRIKYSQGFTRPGPRDFVGSAPLETPESRAMAELSRANAFHMTLSYHTQGEVIYWRYLDLAPEDAEKYAQLFARVSGYQAADTPYESSFAGYKDWFIATFFRPGYTVEAGLGVSPLPLSQFSEIVRANEPLLANALAVA